MNIDKDIEMLNEIIESGWLISDLEKCPAIDACEDAIKALKQYRALQEIRQEIENNMESIIGKYDANTPEHNRPSHKIERNNGRKECLAIIDKHIKEIEGSDTE